MAAETVVVARGRAGRGGRRRSDTGLGQRGCLRRCQGGHGRCERGVVHWVLLLRGQGAATGAGAGVSSEHCLGGQVELEWPAIGRGWRGAPQQRVGQAQDRERGGRLALPRKAGLHDVLPRRPQQIASGGEVVEEQGVAWQTHARAWRAAGAPCRGPSAPPPGWRRPGQRPGRGTGSPAARPPGSTAPAWPAPAPPGAAGAGAARPDRHAPTAHRPRAASVGDPGPARRTRSW